MVELDTCKKKLGACCGGAVALTSLIVFCACMANYVHLHPDDQVLLRRASGKYVVNGPWSGQLNVFHGKTWRKATLLNPLQYAIIQDTMTAVMRREMGPKLLFLGPYEEVKAVHQKLVLERHEYIRLVDSRNGEERVEPGPGTIVPEVTETHTGVQEAIFINVGTAVVVRNRNTGVQSLVAKCSHSSGVWMPEPLEEVIDIRELIHVLPHEAMIVRDVDGQTTVYSGREKPSASSGQCATFDSSGVGGTSFFLPPYSKIVRMKWSVFPDPNEEEREWSTTPPPPAPPLGQASTGNSRRLNKKRRRITREEVFVHNRGEQRRRLESIYVDQLSTSASAGLRRTVTAIDLRSTKSFYSYEVRTNDNVRLLLQGTIFWQIKDIRQMLTMTSDPEGDVWSKSRSTLISAISDVTLGTFMSSFNDIVLTAFDASKNSTFWKDRGITLISIELNNYKPVDQYTADTLQSIIRQTVQRINDLQKQRSKNDVDKEKLVADIGLEKNMTVLIEQQALNTRIVAETAGATEGGKSARAVGSFMDGLNGTLSNSSERLALFRQHKLLVSAQTDATHLTGGNASLYMAPKDVELRLQMPSMFAHSREL
eukprot:CAMPEP_0203890356 /NCGR_PEP_ID=MMETSP0359-20131031/33782_1 /ASSEMBLY_ACC=CAM_ASM_000338 /TAXON_ID=268821 /ORGANISM="Scrippsiella Hangoei, Strain SHTV-5" /LENGTH=595 /DNA_ID=CAMNT_0050811963 /DNA_START=46 /DNA_END=1833 /DNA_ORIENTATION=-